MSDLKKYEELKDQIDMKELMRLLSIKLHNRIDLVLIIENHKKDKHRFEIESGDVKDQMGIFGANLEYAEISLFGGGTFNDSNSSVWFPVYFSYKHLSGGSNGTNIGDFIWKIEEKKWQVRWADGSITE